MCLRIVIVAHLGKGDTEREREDREEGRGREGGKITMNPIGAVAPRTSISISELTLLRVKLRHPVPLNLSDRGSGSPNSWAELPSSSDCGGGDGDE